eukprot:PITA_35190
MGIQLVHSTSYHPQGNGLAESSNKSVVRIIKKNIGGQQKELGFQVEVCIVLILLVAKFFQEEPDETNDMVRSINNLVELQQVKEQLVEESRIHQKRIKETFDRKAKVDNFQVGDWVQKWDALKEKKGNNGKFDSLWTCLFVITQIQQNNTFILQRLEGEDVFGGPVNGQFLKLYFI